MRAHHESKSAAHGKAAAPGAHPRNGSPPKGNGAQHAPDRLALVAQLSVIFAVVVAFAYFASSVVLPALVAGIICLTLQPLVRWLQGIHIPAVVSAIGVVTVSCALVLWGAVKLSKPALEWMQTAPQKAPQLKQKFSNILSPALRLKQAAADIGNLEGAGNEAPKTPAVEVKDHSMSSTVFTWTGSAVAGIGETVALVFLLLATGEKLVSKFVNAMPTVQDKQQAMKISRDIQESISRYLFTVGVINACFGLLLGITLELLGLPNAMMWGVAAALFNFIPYFGPVGGMILVTMAGMFVFDTIGRAVAPGAAYAGLHLIEAYAITPFILGERFQLNPFIIFVLLIFFIWMWGITGALLAMPLLVCIKVVCERVPSLTAFGEILGGVRRRRAA